MNRKKAVAYSLLAHIRNHSSLIKGPLDIFIPLIKRAISLMNKDNIYSGESIAEINAYAKNLYEIDFPLPVLRNVLEAIIIEVGESGQGGFILHNDNSFSIANYTFTEFEETVRNRQVEIQKLEELFRDFCGSSELTIDDTTSIFDFLEKNKLSLAKYLSNVEPPNGNKFLVEVQFINYFKNVPTVYDLLKNLYLGSILSEYLEYTPTDIQMDVELLLDTNFLISLIDLNTPESTHTCNTLVSIAKTQGFKLTILPETIDEIRFLLQKKAEGLDKTFLVKKVYAEDIYNACERRNLTKVDLERIIDNIESTILSFDIQKACDISEIVEEALQSREYEIYKEKRPSLISAKHDAIALYYVKTKRGRNRITDFTDVNCWFVNNAISREYRRTYERHYQPEIIKADDLLSVLWLSNPQINSLISSSELSEIGLSSLVSLAFTESLPKTAIIREFEDNIQKYAKDQISSRDIIRVATRITDKQLTNLEDMNALANEDKELFVQRLEEEAKKQEVIESDRIEALSKIVEKFKVEIEKVGEIKQDRTEQVKTINDLQQKTERHQEEIDRLRLEVIEKEEQLHKIDVDNKVKRWQLFSLLLLIVAVTVFIVLILYIVFYDSSIIKNAAMQLVGAGLMLFFGYIIKLTYDRHFNHSNIEAYKKTL